MSVYRVLNSREFVCSTGHEFKTGVMYEYSTKRVWFEPIYTGKTWIPPLERQGKAVFPVCPECKEVVSHDNITINDVRKGGTGNVHVPDSEAAAIAVHPLTGEEVYCFDRPNAPLPEVWKKEGFVKMTFNHYKDLERHCRERGMVNDIEGDWAHDEGYFEEDLARRQKIYKEQRERYMEEREKVMRAHPELRRQKR